MRKLKNISLILIGLIILYGCQGQSEKKTSEEAPEATVAAEVETTIEKEVISFQKVLTLQNVTFEVTSIGEDSICQLFINTKGLSETNQDIQMEIDGSVVNAEVEDLNVDGFPELVIYTQSAGSGSYGNVIGYSVNNGKSMSQISFPDLSNNKEASAGYMGHDVFLIGETNLIRKFPIYREGDTNNNPTGGTRQIQYKLKDGEASRVFEIGNIIDLDN